MKRTSYAGLIAAIVTAACGGTTERSTEPGNADGGPIDDAHARADGAIGDGGFDAALRPGFVPISCGPNGPSLAALSVTPAFDYVELRVEDGYQTTQQDVVQERVGTLCNHATNVAACKAKFATINHPVALQCGVPYPCKATYLAYTRGDEVATLLSDADLTKLAAPIDSIEEAAFTLAWSRGFTCNGSSYRATADGFDVAYTTIASDCPSSPRDRRHDILQHVSRDGVITTLEDIETFIDQPGVACAAARRAADVTYALPRRISDAGDWLAAAAHLEAASVASFARLARELANHGAPAALVHRVARAAREERQHARALRALARAEGKTVARSPRVSRAPRPLETVALENAVEGETRETWGAIVVAFQARAANSFALRRTFALIAEDEASHAALARDVAEWLSTRLDREARSRVERARQEALVAIHAAHRTTASELPRSAVKRLGLPSREVRDRLFAGACASLFRGAAA